MNFQEKLLLTLKEKGMSQRDLAEKININETALSRYVNGSRKPRMDILVNIARALDVTVEYLVDEKESEGAFGSLRNLVCRNLSDMTDEQKQQLIEILSRKN